MAIIRAKITLNHFKNPGKDFAFITGLLIIIIPYLIWFILGEHSYVLIHDNLDACFVEITKMLKEKAVFTFDLKQEVPGIMNGLPRYVFRSGLYFTFLIFSLLPAIYAYITNHLIVHIVGYIGMFLLLKRYFIKNNHWLNVAISLCFGCLSYYHLLFGISVSGQPLLLFTFLNLLNNRQKWFDWLIICLFPFYSFLLFTLPFFIPFLLALGFGYYYISKKISINYIIGIFLICIINLLIEYPLIYSNLFANEYISHRAEYNLFELTGYPSFKQFLSSVFISLIHTQDHAGRLYPFPVAIAFIAGLFFHKFRFTKTLNFVIGSIGFIIIWVALNKTLVYHLSDKFSLIKTINHERFYLLLPFLWLLLLAILVNEYNLKKRIQRYVAVFVLLLMATGILKNNDELIKNFQLLTSQSVEEPTFRQFYDKKLFTEIKDYIGTDKVKTYNVLSIGLYPNIALYNGFNTLDSYQSNYKLTYKHQFRKIISKELAKDKNIQAYFDYWGSRCYTFSSELGKNYMIKKDSAIEINNLELDTNQIRSMNGKYIISAVPILNYKKIGLKFLRSFSNPDSYWELYLYEI